MTLQLPNRVRCIISSFANVFGDDIIYGIHDEIQIRRSSSSVLVTMVLWQRRTWRAQVWLSCCLRKTICQSMTRRHPGGRAPSCAAVQIRFPRRYWSC